MGRIARISGIASLAVGVMACAGEVEEGATAAGPSDAPPTSPVDVSLKPPELTDVEPFASALRLTWAAPSACDEIEGERKVDDAMFELDFTVPGTDTVFVDATAFEDKLYTYRLRCKKGFVTSGYSNELSANPKDG